MPDPPSFDSRRTVDNFPSPEACPKICDTVTHPPAGATGLYLPSPPADAPIIPGYRITAEIARGGMGRVYAGHDLTLDREVAIKTLVPGADAERFVTEAKITARLPHPGIPPVHALGTLPDGTPYLAMKLIRGRTLAEMLRERPLPLAELPRFVQIFEQIAQAVGFAHAQGIIHRDLKPLNVMVGALGEVQVMDWGVAKLLRDQRRGMRDEGNTGVSSDLSLVPHPSSLLVTQAGAILGTPAYMAPEQARGEVVDARADVFALGATLAAMLTGQPAFVGASQREVIDGAARGDLADVRERLMKSGADKELITLALSCLSGNIADRPVDGRAVAAEVAAYRAGVEARLKRAETERAEALVREAEQRKRRRLVQMAGTLIAVVLLVGLSVSLWQMFRAIAAERQANQNLIAEQQARQDAESARQAEKKKRREANEQRENAERARGRTRQALDAMTSSVAGDSLTTQKQISEEQKKFLTEVLTYYQEFAGEKAEDEQSRSRTAGAALRLGLIEDRLGRKAEAEAADRLACDGYAKLAADYPNEPEYRHGLAGSHKILGDVLRDLGKLPEAEEQFRKAVAICEKLTTDLPAIPKYRYSLASSPHNLIIVLHLLGKLPEAEAQYRQALPTWEKLADDFPKVPEYRNVLAAGHHNMGNLLHDLRKLSEAVDQYRQALPIWEKLAADVPTVPEYRQGLADSHLNLGALLRNLGELREAEEQYRQALAILEKLAADFPAMPEYQVRLGALSCNFGLLVSAIGRPSDSLVWFEKAIRTLTAVYEKDRRLVMAGEFLCNSYAARSRAYGLLGKYAEALSDLDKAVELSANKKPPRFRAERAYLRRKADQVAEAVAEVAELSKIPNWSAGEWYDFACVYAVAGGKFAEKKQEYADRAMELLQQAVKAGYRDAAHMRQDSDLDSLRGRDDFKRLLAELGE